MAGKITGYLLAGGKNSRMGGEKKAFLQWEGKAFYERSREALDFLEETVLSVEKEEPYLTTGMQLVKDRYPGCGPMGAICSGMDMLQTDALLVVPCDVPKIQKESLRKLAACYDETGSLVIIRTKDGLQPLLGLYPLHTKEVFQRHLREGHYRMQGILEEIPHLELQAEDESCVNINTKSEYKQLTAERIDKGELDEI